MSIYKFNLKRAFHPFTKQLNVNIKEMVENKIKDEWPNAKVIGETDAYEQEIRRVHLDLYEIEKQKMEEIQAMECQQQLQLIDKCSKESLIQHLDEVKKRTKQMATDQIDPLPKVEINDNKKSNLSVVLRFKQIRLNYALSYLVCVVAAVNNLHILLASSSLNGIEDLLVIMTLTLIVMGFIFMVGRFSHMLMYGQRLERAILFFLGVAIVLILFKFYLSLANLLIDGIVDEAILKTVHSLPSLELVNDWIITGIALGLLAFILGLWNDNNLELLSVRARNKVIKKRIAKFKKLQNNQIKIPDFLFDQRNQHLAKILTSIRNKERTLNSMKTIIDDLKSNYTIKITEYRAVLANWTGTDFSSNVDTASLFEVEPAFIMIEDSITKDRKNVLVLQTVNDELRETSNKTKQAIFDCFEEEINHLKEYS